MRVLILHSGGVRHDEQDTLVQAQSIEAALSELGHHAARLAFSAARLPQICGALQAERPELVFNLVESPEDMVLAPLLVERLGLPCSGCSSAALALSTNKLLAKRLLLADCLPTPHWVEAGGSGSPRTDAAYLLKPVDEDGSVGIDEEKIRLLHGAAELQAELLRLQQEQRIRWFAEEFIDGREFNLSLLEQNGVLQVLPPAEICFDAFPEDKLRVVGYRAKWCEDSFEFHNTPRQFSFPAEDQPLLDQLCGLALRCAGLFELSGYARVDFRIDRGGRPWILEVNANPGISPDAGFVAAAAQAGLSYTELVDILVQSSVRRGL